MKKIITITGHKSSNKDFLAMDLAKNSAVEFIHPYTDRPYHNVLSEDYHFVTSDELDKLMDEEEIISETMIDGNRYVFFKSQLIADYNVLIVDDYALADLRDKYPRKYLYSIKCYGKNDKDSDRVGVYLYDHEFDEVFHYGDDSIEELEWRIE